MACETAFDQRRVLPGKNQCAQILGWG
jgi:hypothetical protein